jgi:hypothetical protein
MVTGSLHEDTVIGLEPLMTDDTAKALLSQIARAGHARRLLQDTIQLMVMGDSGHLLPRGSQRPLGWVVFLRVVDVSSPTA